jgi:hypothetical protein
MTEPRTEFSRTNGRVAGASRPIEHVEVPLEADSDPAYIDASPPSTPRWVKALGIVLVVLLLAFAGLHLTGNAPTHMMGGNGAPHGIQLP